MPCRQQGERGTCCLRANFVGARVAYSALTRQRARSRLLVTYGNGSAESQRRAWREAKPGIFAGVACSIVEVGMARRGPSPSR
jgi:hypothetical protein